MSSLNSKLKSTFNNASLIIKEYISIFMKGEELEGSPDNGYFDNIELLTMKIQKKIEKKL
jgi:hypothetical protein